MLHTEKDFTLSKLFTPSIIICVGREVNTLNDFRREVRHRELDLKPIRGHQLVSCLSRTAVIPDMCTGAIK